MFSGVVIEPPPAASSVTEKIAPEQPKEQKTTEPEPVPAAEDNLVSTDPVADEPFLPLTETKQSLEAAELAVESADVEAVESSGDLLPSEEEVDNGLALDGEWPGAEEAQLVPLQGDWVADEQIEMSGAGPEEEEAAVEQPQQEEQQAEVVSDVVDSVVDVLMSHGHSEIGQQARSSALRDYSESEEVPATGHRSLAEALQHAQMGGESPAAQLHSGMEARANYLRREQASQQFNIQARHSAGGSRRNQIQALDEEDLYMLEETPQAEEPTQKKLEKPGTERELLIFMYIVS